MEIFISGLPPGATEKRVKLFLRQPLRTLGVRAFDVFIFKKGGNGTLTLPTEELGQRLLNMYGGRPDRRRSMGTGKPMMMVMGKAIWMDKSKHPPDKHAISALADQHFRLIEEERRPSRNHDERPSTKKFEVQSIDCGLWNIKEDDTPVFNSHYQMQRRGQLFFGREGARVTFLPDQHRADTTVVFMPYYEMAAITTSMYGTSHVTFTLTSAPRFYKGRSPDRQPLPQDPLAAALAALSLQHNGAPQPAEPSRVRVSSLDEDHALFAAFCFVYRFTLPNPAVMRALQKLGKHQGIPDIESITSNYSFGYETFLRNFRVVLQELPNYQFPVAFQITALVANGYLPPQVIVRLLPKFTQLAITVGPKITATILQEFINGLDAQNPTKREDAFSDKNLRDILQECARNAVRLAKERRAFEEARENEGKMAYIHHAFITPAGCYFEGPKPETLNRVLRKYSAYHDYFLRVTFGEENGDSVTYERDVSHKFVYERFKDYMFRKPDGSSGGMLIIGGRQFEFLGFSGASLRNHTSWFMAPFEFEGEYLDAAGLIAKLGDFSHIRSPGKCAARIGQAFSNTFNSVHVPLQSENTIEDVQRNNRCFSDGCGTISKAMVQRIWTEAPSIAQQKPTVFQIRFAGAKGVVSLDTRLTGDVLNLRPSMIKFGGSDARNIEICSSAHKPLPMFLNRPLIKILEDLKVPESAFLELQRDEVHRLNEASRRPTLAANFMQRRSIGIGQIKLPWLISTLHTLNLSFQEDEFLGQAFKLALLTALRDIKYRARIEIPLGFTVMGLMDETGILDEGEIFCRIETEEQRSVLVGEIVITRAPAMHPGDVQVCRAVNVPQDSPLQALRNCVIFSQKGERDLPSMLSGGDLDGDLYNLVFDPRFRPHQISEPANYPRVSGMDLRRPVNTEDMVDFLVDFMQNDRLGLISTRHLIIADQKPEGVFHPECLLLAEMHSTAVDFPKTGIPVDVTKLPKAPRVRPDFMAPGPHLLVENNMSHFEPEDPPEEADDDEEAENTPTRYYKSQKILGKLYRAIDETAFLRHIQPEGQSRTVDLIEDVWNYVEYFVTDDDNPIDVPWNSEENLSFARDTKLNYDASVRKMMRDYTLTPWAEPLKEVEVFIGSVVGKGKQNRREKDNSTAMKEDFERVMNYTIDAIRGASDDDVGKSSVDILGRGMACLYTCLQEQDPSLLRHKQEDRLKSFAWVAASVTLQEIDKMQKKRRATERRRVRRALAPGGVIGYSGYAVASN